MFMEIAPHIKTSIEHVLLMKDFNEIMSIEERKGQTTITPSMRKFVEFVQDCHFIDVELKG